LAFPLIPQMYCVTLLILLQLHPLTRQHSLRTMGADERTNLHGAASVLACAGSTRFVLTLATEVTI